MTFTGKEHEAVFPQASVAVQVTMVVPALKTVPEGGTQVTLTVGEQSSWAVAL